MTLNFGRDTVHVCPFCDWSLLHTEYDPAGVEAALLDHMDEVHDLVHADKVTRVFYEQRSGGGDGR